jgi:hypothetical protein
MAQSHIIVQSAESFSSQRSQSKRRKDRREQKPKNKDQRRSGQKRILQRATRIQLLSLPFFASFAALP